jgi:integrase
MTTQSKRPMARKRTGIKDHIRRWERARKVAALAEGAGTSGERQAAEAALKRMGATPDDVAWGKLATWARERKAVHKRQRAEARQRDLAPKPEAPKPEARAAKKQFTDLSVKNLRPGATAREVPDGRDGLYCIVQASGHKSWAVRYIFKGKQVKYTIGSYPDVSLADARIAAIEAREQAKSGDDPHAAKKAAKIAEAEAKADTVVAVCESFLALKAKKLRSVDHQRSMLRRLIYDTPLGATPIEKVKRSEIVKLLDRIEAKTGARSADMTLAILRRTFNWYALRSDSFNSPIVPGMSRYVHSEHRGERILNDDEIRKLWEATADGAPFSALVRFLLLTSARRNEAAGLRREEVDPDGVWTLPAVRSKTKKDVTRPLSKAALAILAERPRIADCPWAFSTTATSPLNSFSEPMVKLRKASGTSGWRLHDLRRTARSLMSRAGVNPDIAERCLGHALPGIRGVYDHHDYIEQMKFAVEALAAQIERIVHPLSDVVVPLVKKRRR